MAETPAHKGFDDANVGRIHLQATGQGEMHVVGNLGDRVQRQVAALRVKGGQRRIGLHHGVMDLGAVVVVLSNQVGSGKAGGRIAELVMNLPLDVARFVVMEQHRVGSPSLGRAEIRRQFPNPKADQ